MNNKEINISELIGLVFTNLYKFIAKWFKMLTVFFTIGVLVGVLFYFVKKDTYVSTIIAKSGDIDRVELLEILNSLKPITKNDTVLAESLNLNLAEAERIVTISADTIDFGFLEVSIVYKDEMNYPKVQEGILSFVEENVYIAREIRLYKEGANKTKKELTSEIEDINKLQKVLLEKVKKESQVSFKQPLVLGNQNTSFHYDEILNRAREIIQIESNIVKIQGLTMIKPCTPVKINKYPLIIIVIISSLLFLFLGLFLSIILSIRQLVSKK